MKELPNHRDEHRQRERIKQKRALNHEQNGYWHVSRRSVSRGIVLGLLLGSFFYLMTSCYHEQRLHEPKLDREKFRFDHQPQGDMENKQMNNSRPMQDGDIYPMRRVWYFDQVRDYQGRFSTGGRRRDALFAMVTDGIRMRRPATPSSTCPPSGRWRSKPDAIRSRCL
jgi:hypothetical protein